MKFRILLLIPSLLVAAACEPPVDPACKGAPVPDCTCYMIYAPVCGCDGETYANDCVASCEGVKSWTPGPCAN